MSRQRCWASRDLDPAGRRRERYAVLTAGPGAGFTLIELLMAMVIIGVAAVVFLNSFRNLLPRSPTPAEVTQAGHLAQQRLEAVLGQRRRLGYAGIIDPCASSPPSPPAPCSILQDYAVTVTGVSPFVTWPINTDTNLYRLITVTVKDLNGAGMTMAVETALVANY